MFHLSYGPRLNARTTPRIHKATKMLVNKLAADGITFDSRIISVETLISAILKLFLDLPYDSQKQILERVLPELMAELKATESTTKD